MLNTGTAETDTQFCLLYRHMLRFAIVEVYMDKANIKEALKGLLPLKIGEEYKEKLKGAIPVKGSMTAAQAVAAALIGKAIEGDSKAFSLVYELSLDEKVPEEENEEFNVDIRVVD